MLPTETKDALECRQ